MALAPGLTRLNGAFFMAENLRNVTGNVLAQITNTRYMFYGTTRLVNLDVVGYDMHNVINMEYMFGYAGFNGTGLGNWINLFGVENMQNILAYADNLTADNVTAFLNALVNAINHFRNVRDDTGFRIIIGFRNSPNIRLLNYHGWQPYLVLVHYLDFQDPPVPDDTLVPGYRHMMGINELRTYRFPINGGEGGIIELANIAMNGIVASATTYPSDIGTIIIDDYIPNFPPPTPPPNNTLIAYDDTSNIYYMYYYGDVQQYGNGATPWEGVDTVITSDFSQLSDATSLTSLTSLSGALNGAIILTTFTAGTLPSSIVDLSYLFNGCSSFTSTNLDACWNVVNVTDMQFMFAGCSSLSNLDLSSWNVSNVVNMQSLFQNCAYDGTGLSTWNIASVTNMQNMFDDSSITQGNFESALDTWYRNSQTPNGLTVGVNNIGFNQLSYNGYVNYMKLKTEKQWTFVPDFQSSSTISFTLQLTPSSTSSGYVGFVELPIITDTNGNYYYYIDWGDGTVELTNFAHTYTDVPTPNVTIRIFLNVRFYGGGWTFGSGYIVSADISNLQYSPSLTSLQDLFNGAPQLTTVTGNVTSQITNISGMFAYCSSFNGNGLSSWDVSSVTDMTNAFDNTGITKENFSSALYAWSNQSVQPHVTVGDIGISVNANGYLSYLNLYNFNNWTFNPVPQLDDLPTMSLVTTVVITTAVTFSLPITGNRYFVDWGDGNITINNTWGYKSSVPIVFTINIYGDFNQFGNGFQSWQGADHIYSADISNMSKAPSLRSFSGAFYGSTGLASITGKITNQITDTSFMFQNSKITGLDGNWDVSSVTNMKSMFNNCSSFVGVNMIDNWNVSKVTDMSYMFNGCSSFQGTDVSYWNTKSVRNTRNMFAGCNPFQADLQYWNVSYVTDAGCMFYNCFSFLGSNVSSWIVSNVTDMDYMFNNCSSFIGNGLGNWDVSSVTNTDVMFYGCNKLAQDLSSWNTRSLTSASYMFASCGIFTGYGLSSWNIQKIKNMEGMLDNCTSIQTDILDDILFSWANFAQNNVVQSSVPFGCSGLTCYNTGYSSFTNVLMNKYGWHWSDSPPTVIASTSFVFYYPRQLNQSSSSTLLKPRYTPPPPTNSPPLVVELPMTGNYNFNLYFYSPGSGTYVSTASGYNNNNNPNTISITFPAYSHNDYYFIQIVQFNGGSQYNPGQLGLDTRAFQGSQYLTNVLINTTCTVLSGIKGLCYGASSYINQYYSTKFQTGLPYFYMDPWPTTNNFYMSNLFYSLQVPDSVWDSIVSENSWKVIGQSVYPYTYAYDLYQIFDYTNMTQDAFLALLNKWLTNPYFSLGSSMPVGVNFDYYSNWNESDQWNTIYSDMINLELFGFNFSPLNPPPQFIEPPSGFVIVDKKHNHVVIPPGFVVVHKKHHKKHHKKRVPKKRNMKQMTITHLSF
jgi:surface protein